MPLESATWISDLVNSNPPGTDQESQGANHLRLLKSVLQNTFPTTGKAWPFPTSAAKSANYSVQKADFNTKFVATTSGGAFTFTLPTLVAGDSGWTCEFIKIGTDTNPFFIAPPSGTLQSGEISGLSTSRRCIPGRVTQAVWTGSIWLLTRVPSVPVGTILDYSVGSTLPVGYEWPNGQTLSSSANYPDFNSVNGGLITADIRERAIFGTDLGGSASSRITVAGGNYDGTTPLTAGGGQNQTLTTAQLPVVTPTGTFTGNQQTVNTNDNVSKTLAVFGSGGFAGASQPTSPTSVTFTPTGSIAINSFGSGNSHPIMPPSIVMSKILVVE